MKCKICGGTVWSGIVLHTHCLEQLRRPVVKALRRVQIGTLPEILRYWLEGWPFTVIGAAILFGIVYGFAALMQAVGA